jgi:hypothetical protein
MQFQQGLTLQTGRTLGYSRYVFREKSEGVVPSLVAGPLIRTVRCQDEALPCSFADRRHLHESTDEIPAEFGMAPCEVAELAGQLTALNEFADAHRDENSACADRFLTNRIPSPRHRIAVSLQRSTRRGDLEVDVVGHHRVESA